MTQAEALLEAGATVYALDRLPEPSPDFYRIQKRAADELGTTLYYRQIDVRDVDGLNEVIAGVGDKHGRLDGLIAAAGIQQETPACKQLSKLILPGSSNKGVYQNGPLEQLSSLNPNSILQEGC